MNWQQVITVVVGAAPDTQTFTVHRELICGKSDFFRNAMKPEWKEGQDHEVHLPSHKPEVFEQYLKLLYVVHVLFFFKS